MIDKWPKESMMDGESSLFKGFYDPEGHFPMIYEKRGEGPVSEYELMFPSLFFPRCASVFQLTTPQVHIKDELDAYHFTLIPPRTKFLITGMSAVSEFGLFQLTPHLIDTVAKQYDEKISEFFESLSAIKICLRNNWLNEIMCRYAYERMVAGNKLNPATEFLEQEIVKEVYYRLTKPVSPSENLFDLDSTNLDGRSPLLRSAMLYIDANLFRDIAVTDIAQTLGVSESTVLREFQSHLGYTPHSFITKRRLDEALMLLKSQRYSISEVSDIIGYENISAFSASFKKRFGIKPSQVLSKTSGKKATILSE
jgi:AraC-like DNA-binding protein